MRKKRTHVEPVEVAFVFGMCMAILAFFATIIALFNPNFVTITSLLYNLYSGLGYSISTLGIILGPAYAFTDTFIFVWVIVWIRNYLIKTSS